MSGPLKEVDWTALWATLARRDLLCSHVPHCPRCREQMQIQLRLLGPPAEWRCRMCKHPFVYEPNEA